MQRTLGTGCVRVTQTFTFVQNTRPRAQALFKRLAEKYSAQDETEIPFPSYVGNSCDATHRAGPPGGWQL